MAHRALEDEVLGHLERLRATPAPGVEADVVEAAIAAEGRLGDDQAGPFGPCAPPAPPCAR